MMTLANCGRLTREPATCDACGRRLRCVYVLDDGGWAFMFGRRCFAKLQAFLGPGEGAS